MMLILALLTALIVLSGIYGRDGGAVDVCPGDSLVGQMWDSAWHWWDPQRYPPACRRGS